MVKDPDEEVAAAVADVFAAFTASGSAFGVVAAFAARRFPGGRAGTRSWGRLTYSRVVALLHNPVYAGAYAFGLGTAPASRSMPTAAFGPRPAPWSGRSINRWR